MIVEALVLEAHDDALQKRAGVAVERDIRLRQRTRVTDAAQETRAGAEVGRQILRGELKAQRAAGARERSCEERRRDDVSIWTLAGPRVRELGRERVALGEDEARVSARHAIPAHAPEQRAIGVERADGGA